MKTNFLLELLQISNLEVENLRNPSKKKQSYFKNSFTSIVSKQHYSVQHQIYMYFAIGNYMAISQIFCLNCGVPSMHFCQFLFCFATKDSVLFFCDHLLRVGLNYPLKWPSKGAQRLVKVAISTGCMFDFTVAMTFTLYSLASQA